MEQAEKELVAVATRMAENAIRDVHKFLFTEHSLWWNEHCDYINEADIIYPILLVGEELTSEQFINRIFMGAGSLAAQGARLLGLQADRLGSHDRPLGHLTVCYISLDISVLTLRLKSRAKART